MHSEYEPLRAAYDAAFAALRQEVARLCQILESSPSPAEEEEARQRVEQALCCYRESRERLGRYLASLPPTSGGTFRKKVQELAYRLWEEAGRPAGRAPEHWFRAEELLNQQR